MSRKNQNLSRDEAAYLRGLAARHGLTARSGPYAGQGSAFAIQLALIRGDAAIVSMDPDDRRAVAAWIVTVAPTAPAHLQELLRELAADLVVGEVLREPLPPSATPGGPIDTLEG